MAGNLKQPVQPSPSGGITSELAEIIVAAALEYVNQSRRVDCDCINRRVELI